MNKRITGAGVNRMAARKASEVAAARAARLAAYEKTVTEAVGVFFDRRDRAQQVRAQAQQKADLILADAVAQALLLGGEADQAVAVLKGMGEPVVEIATMTGLPVSGVRAALARAGTATSAAQTRQASHPSTTDIPNEPTHDRSEDEHVNHIADTDPGSESLGSGPSPVGW